MKHLMQTTKIPDKFKLTEEQLVQINIEENISIVDVEHIIATQDNPFLNENQMRSLIAYINSMQQSQLALNLDQFIELCNRQSISVDQLFNNETALQKSSTVNSSSIKFSLSRSQIAHLIKQNNFDIRKLKAIENKLKNENVQASQFRLNASQLAYLFANRRIARHHDTFGLSAPQLIALYMLHRQSTTDNETVPFLLNNQQIKHLAIMQNMTTEHFQSLTSSKKPFQLTLNQMIHIATEHKIPVKQILSIPNNQKLKLLDHKQLCILISQHSQPNIIQNSLHHTHQYLYLTVEQIFSLAKYSGIKLDQVITCNLEQIEMVEFRLKPEQLAVFWNTNISFDNIELPTSLSQFILSDEQFSSLLDSVSTSALLTHSNTITTVESTSEIKSSDSVETTQVSTDMKHQLSSTLADQLAAMHERLKSSIQAHSETVKIISDSMLKRNHVENSLNLVHQLSLHSIDDLSTKEVETIPSFILDLLKMNTITEDTFKSIKQDEITSDVLEKLNDNDIKSTENLSKTIIESIQSHQLTLPQIQKIQTQLLTPNLYEEFKSGQLSQRILDAYKSQSPMQIINKVRTSIAQLNTLLLQQSSSIPQLDTMITPIVKQTATKNTVPGDDTIGVNSSIFEEHIASAEHVKVLPQNIRQDPIVIYPESAPIRQQILQELRDRLDTQLIDLRKEYNIEPIKGKASIRQITNNLRTMAVTEELESLIGRQIDEVDILNILDGHSSNLLDQAQMDIKKTKDLFDHNTKQRLTRINDRMHLVNILQNHIENERLKRPINLEEFTALFLEDIPKFEQLTNIQLTGDDLRIISMNRFASVEQSMSHQLSESEYRHLLENNLAFDYIEQELLKRPLTTDERNEQEELTSLPYEELLPKKHLISSRKISESLVQQNIQPTHAQLEQILRRRAELIDQYNIIHSISPTVELIEEQLRRPLTFDEKKRLAYDDYSIIKQIKSTKYKDLDGKPKEILPITASLLQLIETTQDKNLLENINRLETFIERSLTKQEILMAANGDINGLEKAFNKSLPTELIQSMYNNRFTNLRNDLNRDLTEKEMRDVLRGSLSGIENILGRQLTSKERLVYKPVNVIDLTASQLTNPTSIDTTVQELEDVLERRLTLPEIEFLSDEQKESIKNLSLNNEIQQIDIYDVDVTEDLLILGRISRRPIHFTLLEIEKALGRSLTSDELQRFAGSRFAEIESDLGKALTDLQRSNLLNGDKLTIERLIGRQLSSIETGPHTVDITAIEQILNRPLTFDELMNLAGDRFDEIQEILQRQLTQEELIDLLNGNYDQILKLLDEELDRQKEKELKELPINRIKYFEKILHRKLSSNELIRFAEDRFQPITRLLTDYIKPEQILDLSSGSYDKIQTYLHRSLTSKEKSDLEKSLLQVHMKYSNTLEEIEHIIQRRLNEEELRNLAGNQFHKIETRLGKSLTEKQLRNLLQGKEDQSLIGVDDLLDVLKRKYDDNYKRTRIVATRLIEKIDQEYHEEEKELVITKSFIPSSDILSIQKQQSDIEFHKSTMNLLEQLSDDVRKHKIVTQQDSYPLEILDTSSISSSDALNKRSSIDKEQSPTLVSSSHILPRESIKAFDNTSRIGEQITEEEHIEEVTTLNTIIQQFQEKPSTKIDAHSSNPPIPTSISSVDKDTTPSTHSLEIESIDTKPITREPAPELLHNEEELYLGWTLFKGADRSDLGLKEEKPRMINVKHFAQTYVVGIPEEYADDRSKNIANKIYRGETIHYRYPKSQIIKEMNEFVSEVSNLPTINDATHFIVPSRAYIDISESVNTYQSELINIENDESQMVDSPETLEWYEECIQRNIHIHAQIPTGYQPSVVFCYTGRRTIITPAKRAEQRKISLEDSSAKSKTMLIQPIFDDIPSTYIERLSQPMFDTEPSTPTSQTVTDLIMHTITNSKKADLLESLEELFSQENLEKYQISENHWQDIFLILLNSYLHSHSLNRKDIFKRLTDKLYELRKNERRSSSEFYPSISIISPPLNESDLIKSNKKQFHFGLQPSANNTVNTDQSPNDSEYSRSPGQQSVTSPVDNKSSTQLFVQNHDALTTLYNLNYDKNSLHSPNSMEYINKNPVDTKQDKPINFNAIIERQASRIPKKPHRYKITVLHSDEVSDISTNKCKTTTESTKLPPITPNTRSSQQKQSRSTDLLHNQFLSSSSTAKRIQTKILSKFQKK